MPSPLRLLLLGAALAVGAVAGGLGSFVHAFRVAGLPLGLLCALALTASAFFAAGLAVGGRSGAVAAAAGWAVALLLLSAPRPEGDLVVSGSALGYAWMAGGMLIAAVAIAWPYGGGTRPRATPSAPPFGGR